MTGVQDANSSLSLAQIQGHFADLTAKLADAKANLSRLQQGSTLIPPEQRDKVEKVQPRSPSMHCC